MSQRRCHKIRYRTEIDAMIAMSRWDKGHRREKEPTRYYRCPQCGGYHLTSKGRNHAL